MPSPFYRQSSSGGGGGGSISEAGAKGALALFGEVKASMTDLQTPFLPSRAEEAASAKAAADAYAGAKNAITAPGDAMSQSGALDVPELNLGDSASFDFGKAMKDLMAGMGDLLNSAIASPVGFIGSLLGFLFKMFTEIIGQTIEVLNEMARAAAAAIEEAAKKQLELARSTSTGAGLQPLELFNQAASTQTVSHAMKTAAVQN